MDQLAILRRIEHRVAESHIARRPTVRVGPFLGKFHPTDPAPWYSYAMPLSSAPPSADIQADLAMLAQEFATRQRSLRFEYFEELWPELSGELERFGLKRDARQALMACTPSTFHDRPGPAVPLNADDPDSVLAEFHQAARDAFGDPHPPAPNAVSELRENIACGFYASAYVRIDGRIAGVGTLLDCDELCGIGTIASCRRSGVASATCSLLIRERFAAGNQQIWLSAGDPTAERVYARLGFVPIGWQLNYWL